MPKEISNQLTRFRDASTTFGSVTLDSPGTGAVPIRAGFRVWLKSVLNIGDTRRQNARTIEAFRQAILTSPRYASLTDRAQALTGRLDATRPLSSRSIRKTLGALDGVLREGKRVADNRATTQARILSLCGFGNSVASDEITRPIMALRHNGDPSPEAFKRSICQGFKTMPQPQWHDYTKGPMSDNTLKTLVAERVKFVTDCLAMLNEKKVDAEFRKLLWKVALRDEPPISSSTLPDMQRLLQDAAPDSNKSKLLAYLNANVTPGQISLALTRGVADLYHRATGRDIPVAHLNSASFFGNKLNCVSRVFRKTANDIKSGKITSERSLNVRRPPLADEIQNMVKLTVQSFITDEKKKSE